MNNTAIYSAPFSLVNGPAKPKGERFYVTCTGKRLLARLVEGTHLGYQKVEIVSHANAAKR